MTTKILRNEFSLAKIGVDTAENEPEVLRWNTDDTRTPPLFHPARLLREELHEVLEEVRALHVAVVVLVELREEPGLPAELQHLLAKIDEDAVDLKFA